MALTAAEEQFVKDEKARYEADQAAAAQATKRQTFLAYREAAYKKAREEKSSEWQGYEDAQDIPAGIVTELDAYDPSLPGWP